MPRTIVAARLTRVCFGLLVCGALVGCLDKGKSSTKGKSYFDNNATAGKPSNPWANNTPTPTNTTAAPRTAERNTAFNPGMGNSMPSGSTGVSNPPMDSQIRRTEASMNSNGQFTERNPASFNGPTPGLTAPSGQGPSAQFQPASNQRTGMNINTFDPPPPGPRGNVPLPPPPPQPAIMGAEEPFRSNSNNTGNAGFQPMSPNFQNTPPPAPNPGGFVAPGPN